MRLWVVKGGRVGEREEMMLNNGKVAIGWEDMPDLLQFGSRDELKAKYRETYPDSVEGKVNTNAGQLWNFSREMKRGDLVAVPLKTRSAVAVGEISGDYRFDAEDQADCRHTRSTKWINKETSRSRFEKDLLFSFGSAMTVCSVSRNDAVRRVLAIAKGAEPPIPSNEEAREDEEFEYDLEEQALEQLRSHIGSKFKGHDLARLVDGILRAQGFRTRFSPPGPDGGADILALKEDIGICVQVKSSDSPLDVKPLRELSGVVSRYRADQGVLVSWGGFKETTLKEAHPDFFKIRLWTSGDLIAELLSVYDRLPEDLRAEIPLKRVWMLAD